MTKPAFLITIDTEGDNIWQNHYRISTKNTHFLPRFQALCERYDLKPVYLTNYEMALDPAYIEFARNVLSRRAGEIGMHLHPWNSPPLAPLTADDGRYKPYLIEYPADQARAKVGHMTKLLEDTFQTKILSHRAGRWAFNEYYAALLLEYGYQVDCSVTPGINWQFSPGNPHGFGGTDYRDFPTQAYFIDLENIAKPGASQLLEVPMSMQYKYSTLLNILKKGFDRLRGKQRTPSMHWLRPSGNNLNQMKKVTESALAHSYDHLQFMLHSSELMPGGSPIFKTDADIEVLYRNLETLFDWLRHRTVNMTLGEFYTKSQQK
ncbi:Putative conserved hypothetical protein [Serratia symbiotica]|nr:Putative conserved hypothetical protein [Serratia symbiotica]